MIAIATNRQITFNESAQEWQCRFLNDGQEVLLVAASKAEMEEKLDAMDRWLEARK